MNKELAASLIHPLKIGDDVFGWTLSQIHIEFSEKRFDHNRAVYDFSSQATVVVQPITEGVDSAAVSKNFSISVKDSGGDFNEKAFKRIVSLIQQNDTEGYRPLQTLNAPLGQLQAGATLYVVPGHIGCVRDLSHRAIQVLLDCDLIMVETGKTNDIEQIMSVFNIQLPSKRIVEFEHLGQTEMSLISDCVANQGSICLFGGGEGLPTLCDPGWKLISWANSKQIPIRTLSGGGALSAAIMRLGTNKPFSFWGLLQINNWRHSIVNHLTNLKGVHDVSLVPMPICFASGSELRPLWPQLCRATLPFKGCLHVMIGLTTPAETEIRLDFSDLSDFDIESLAPETKMVLVFDLHSNQTVGRVRIRQRMRTFFKDIKGLLQ